METQKMTFGAAERGTIKLGNVSYMYQDCGDRTQKLQALNLQMVAAGYTIKSTVRVGANFVRTYSR